jgi:hypothetical protein
VLALAIYCGTAHYAELAQAEDPPPKHVLVRLDSDVLVPTIERPIEEVQAVDEVILGVRMIGTAQVTGQPKVKVADDPNDAAFSSVPGTIIRGQQVEGPCRLQPLDSSLRRRSASRFTPAAGSLERPLRLSLKRAAGRSGSRQIGAASWGG